MGSIAGVELVPGASEVTLELDDGHELPAAVDAAVRRRSAIGEPYVDLFPTPGTSAADGPRLADGDRIPEERTSSPVEYSDLFRSLDDLVQVIDPEDLRILVSESADAVDGRGDDIRRLVLGTHDLATTAQRNGDEIEAFVDDLGSIASVAAAHQDALVDFALDQGSAEALGRMFERSAEISHIIEGAIDDRDGYVRLMMQMSAGTPVPLYAEPLQTPVPPSVSECPARDIDPAVAGTNDEAALGAGGERPSADPDRDDLALAGGDDGDRGPSGTSDQEPEEDFLVRFVRIALPLALAGWQTQRLGDVESDVDRRADAARTASEFALALLSYDFEALDEQTAAITGLATDDFAEEFTVAMDGGLGASIAELRARSTASINEVMVSEVPGDRARAVVIADSEITSEAGNRASTDTYLDISLVHLDDRWQVDDVRTIATASPDVPVPETPEAESPEAGSTAPEPDAEGGETEPSG